MWQDNWYSNRKQEEIHEDIVYYIKKFNFPDSPADIMKESVMIRKSWAIRLSLALFTSPDYGFRGRRIRMEDGYLENKGEVVYGSDTFRILPEEIIVGAMPNLSLEEGKYVINYLSKDE